MGRKKKEVRIQGKPVEVHRSKLHAAAYNPREIGPEEFKGLCKSIEAHGLVELPVWNKRTGNVVSGHQRLRAADKVFGTDDWMVSVIAIDVDEKEEKILNVKLNSEHIRGDWDLEALADLKKDIDVDWGEFGLVENFGMLMGIEESDFDRLMKDCDDVVETKGTLKEIKEEREDAVSELKDEQSADFYFTVVCRSQKDKQELMRAFGAPEYEDFISSDKIRLRMGE